MNNGVKEFHDIVKVSGSPKSFQEQLNYTIRQVASLTEGRTVMFIRFFLSDAANQQESLLRAMEDAGIPDASIIQQAPLDGSKIAAWVWSVEGKLNPAYTHHVTYGIKAPGADSKAQMDGIFEKYGRHLGDNGMSIADDCMRTWIFVRDVDTNYEGVVNGRKEYFDGIGLTPETHYISSTGIQGSTPDFRDLAVMDAYAVKGLQPSQIQFLQAKTHLNPTYEYGVTFERGTALTYADRKHIFISGTASIDNKGEILHPGDVTRQASRMMENISALLSEADASLDDIKVSIVYLRDTADYSTVAEYFHEHHPGLDPIFVLAPVCRPGWLIEMECIAARELSNSDAKPFQAL